MKKLNSGTREFIYINAAVFLGIILLSIYIIIVQRIGQPVFHCFLHDILHLYCPFCGGSRAFAAMRNLDFITMFLCNPWLVLEAVMFMVAEVRAIYMIIIKKNFSFPGKYFMLISAVTVILFFVIRNALMIFGVYDFNGELGNLRM